MSGAYFIFRGYDVPETSAAIRTRIRPEHRAYIREARHGVRVAAGGMVVTDADDHVTGTLLILHGPDRAAVMRYLGGDPYWAAGLFARYELDRWTWGLGAPAEEAP
ncbi:YciI family protein [Novosphingobium sp. FSW06-99]|uniref:YciI family protein n=1 Tax=Novosphingobium sp. FSW06-99 TaxID=1739113 RepID=UPI00076DE793|nr:YciI family protein [Novosphingobium sp. FSW06-99]KUR79544.1 hypothetical protein AQZ49_05055 [Novosphingobium sp. FSW06-99]